MEPLPAEALALVEQAYGLGRITRHWSATHGIENRNFFLSSISEGLEREFVLTVMERPAASGGALVPLLDTCAAVGLPVPAPVRTRDGATELSVAGKPAMLCPRLPGRHVVNPTEQQVGSLGRFLARLHTCGSATATMLPSYPRTADWLREHAQSCQPSLPYFSQRMMQDAVSEMASVLRRQDVDRLPKGAIHGDVFRDNVLFNRWGLSGVLDFHHASRGFLTYDLAVAANDWCTDPTGAVDLARLLALLAGYHVIRPLEPAELSYLPAFMLYAGLAFWLSRLLVALEQRRGRADRANDPLVFERIVARRRSTPVYVDPWLLDQKVAARER